MRLATFLDGSGREKIGTVVGDTLIDLAAAYRLDRGADEPAFGSMLALIDGSERALDLARATAERGTSIREATLPLAGTRLLSPVPVPRQIRDFLVFETHIRQAGAAMARIQSRNRDHILSGDLPAVYREQPVYYKGNRFTVVGHDADVLWPRYSGKLDFELEIGIFTWGRGRDIPAADARRHIFGYTIFNDFSARDAQALEMRAPLGPGKGKDFDTGNAIGPWIVTAEEIPDAKALTMAARVNGEEWARGSSGDMMFTFEEIIAHLSRDETVFPGEFLGSGTVGGGSGFEIDRWIKPGDVVELEVSGIGTLRNRVVPPDAERLRQIAERNARLLAGDSAG